MWPVTREFIRALRGSHGVVVRADVYHDGVKVIEDLDVVDGSVRVDGGSKVRRVLQDTTVAVDEEFSDVVASALHVNGAELAISRGVRYPTGRIELAPVGRFRIDTRSIAVERPGVFKLTAPDVSARVADDRFLAPYGTGPGKTKVALIEELITDSIPGATVVDESGDTTKVPAGVVFERERWDACLDLATSIGCDVFADPSGDFVIRPVKDLADRLDWLVNAGEFGVLLAGERSVTREGVYNVVVATSQPIDGGAPVSATVYDGNPLSPTYWQGPYGRVPRFYSSSLLTTYEQCVAAAASILSRALGARGTLTLDAVANPALEVGDRVDLYIPSTGLYERHLVDSFTLPLNESGSMAITTRSAKEVEGE